MHIEGYIVGHIFTVSELFFMNLKERHFYLFWRSVPAFASGEHMQLRALTFDTGVPPTTMQYHIHCQFSTFCLN